MFLGHLGAHKQETSLNEADPNLKIWLGIFLAMHRYEVIVCGKISIYCKVLDSATEICSLALQRIISCGNSGQEERQPDAGIKAVPLPGGVWSVLKACSGRSLFTLSQVVCNVLFVHVSAALTFSHTYALSLLFSQSVTGNTCW